MSFSAPDTGFDIDNFLSSFCPPGGCMSCMGCSSQSLEKSITAEQMASDPAIRKTEYSPKKAPIEVASMLYEGFWAAYWTGGKLHKPTVVTYSFANSFSDLGAGIITGAQLTTTGRWTTLPESFREQVRLAAAAHSSATGIELIEVADPDTAQIVWRAEEFVETSGLGVIMAPGPNKLSGDIWLNMKYWSTFEKLNMNVGTEGFTWILHEFGHSIGMKHLFDQKYKSPSYMPDNRNTTIMSHTLDPNGTVRSDLSTWDIKALSYIYGTKEQQAALSVQWTQLPGGGLISVSGNAADTVTGIADRDWQEGGAGNDTLLGFAGDDTLDGGIGNDVAIGGVGRDAFVVHAVYGDSQSYQLEVEKDPLEVTGYRGVATDSHGRDVFAGIEDLIFYDGKLDLATGAWTPNKQYLFAQRINKVLGETYTPETLFRIANALQLAGDDEQSVIQDLVESSIEAHASRPTVTQLLKNFAMNAYGGAPDALVSSWLRDVESGTKTFGEIVEQLASSLVVGTNIGQSLNSYGPNPLFKSGHSAINSWFGVSADVPLTFGTNGADAFMSSGGSTVFHGGAGHDTIYVSALHSASSSWSTALYRNPTHSGVDGKLMFGGQTIDFTNVEEIRFLDGSLFFGTDSDPLRFARISLAMTGRLPSTAEFAEALAELEMGTATTLQLANELVLTPEFISRMSVPSATNTTSIIYNMFAMIAGRTPTANDLRGWDEIFKNYGHGLTGYFADQTSKTSLSQNMFGPAVNNGLWVERNGGDELYQLFRVAAGYDPKAAELQGLQFKMHYENLSYEKLASYLASQHGLSALRNVDFVNRVVEAYDPRMVDVAAITDDLTAALNNGTATRGGIILSVASDATGIGINGIQLRPNAAPDSVYSWRFTAINGDWYSGWTVDDGEKYEVGDTITNAFGHYTVNGELAWAGSAGRGTVYTVDYYDASADVTMPTYAWATLGSKASGTGGLGSEYDHAWDGDEWSDFGAAGANLANASISKLFSWTFTANNGDAYSGWTIDDAELYQPGQSLENAFGQYDITGEYAWGGTAGRGTVYTTSYYDTSTSLSMSTYSWGTLGGSPSGTAGLGSEYDYAWDGDEWSDFGAAGANLASATISNVFLWTFIATNGDAYSGWVVADAMLYEPGQNLTSEFGRYDITGEYAWGGTAVRGTVYTTSYYDASATTNMSTYSWGTLGGQPSGTGGLGSEYDYAWDGDEWSDFGAAGANLANASVTKVFSWNFHANNGDVYSGWAVDDADLYQAGQILTNGFGRYDITGEFAWGGLAGQGTVYTTSYYDASALIEMPTYSWGTLGGRPSGSRGLGSEYDYAWDGDEWSDFGAAGANLANASIL